MPGKVSLRGSLADQCYRRQTQDPTLDLYGFVTALLRSPDHDIMAFIQDDMRIVGRHSEQGRFRPDW